MIDPNVVAQWVTVRFSCRCTTGFAVALDASLLEDVAALQGGVRPTLVLTDLLDGEAQVLRGDRIEHIAVRPIGPEELGLMRQAHAVAERCRMGRLRKVAAKGNEPAGDDGDDDGDEADGGPFTVEIADGENPGAHIRKALEQAFESRWGRGGGDR